MNILGSDFVSYEVSDIQQSVAFYRDTVGMKLTSDWSEHGFAEFDAAPTTLSLVSAPQVMQRPVQVGGGMLWLAVSDVDAALAELKEKGTKVVMDKMDTPVCHMAIFLDPDGNSVGLHHRKDGTVG